MRGNTRYAAIDGIGADALPLQGGECAVLPDMIRKHRHPRCFRKRVGIEGRIDRLVRPGPALVEPIASFFAARSRMWCVKSYRLLKFRLDLTLDQRRLLCGVRRLFAVNGFMLMMVRGWALINTRKIRCGRGLRDANTLK